MKTTLSLKQYQILSAYVDGCCTPREKARVESLLETNAEIKQTLAELVRYKKMIAAVPSVRAPRNFTLSPSLVPHKPQRFFAVPALNYAALTAVFLSAILFAGSRILPLGMMQKTSEQAVPMMAAAAEDASAEATSIPMITWGIGGAEGKGGGGAEGSRAYGLGGGPSVESAPQTTEPPAGAEPALLSTEAPMLSMESDAAVNSTNPILGLPSEDTQGKVITQESQLRSPISLSWLTITEIGLAGIALVCAITAFILRKHR
jgi:hypothetical protein